MKVESAGIPISLDLLKFKTHKMDILEKRNNLLRYIVKRVKDIDDAEDILQNSYLTFYLKKQNKEIENEFSYLFGIIKLNIINYFSINKLSKGICERYNYVHSKSVAYNEAFFKEDIIEMETNYQDPFSVLICGSTTTKPQITNKKGIMKTYEYNKFNKGRSKGLLI